MIWIIDGYNLLFNPCWKAHGKDLEEKREHLIQELARYRRVHGIKRLVLVFDGQSGMGPYDREVLSHGLEIVYAVCEGKADEKIVSLVERLTGVCVVTTDRGLAKKVKRAKGEVVSSEEFLFHLKSGPPKNLEESDKTDSTMSENEMEKWLECFGLESEIEIPNKPPPGFRRIQKKIRKHP